MLACSRCGSCYGKDQEFCGIDGERLQELATDPMIGRTIDRYKIEDAIGEGGMARVYRARHTFLEQHFAVKILFGDLASDKNVARRFQREAQAASKLKHPNVVATLDMGQSTEGLIFMAMELLDGRTLTEVIREEGAMPPERAAFFVRQILSGLCAAHALGFVHRDLKPKNIMLVAGEVLKILDFGLVQLSDTSGGLITDATNLTQQGQVFGTPAYMAPEQCAGQKTGPAADLYAVGVILYQLLAGSVPFSGAAAQIAIHHVSTAPPPLLPSSGLGPLALRLLAKKPEDRPASAEAVIEEIDALDFSHPSAPPMRSAPPVKAWAPAKIHEAPESLSFPGEISLTSERLIDYEEVEDQAIRRGGGAAWIGAIGLLALLGGLGYAYFGDRIKTVAALEKPKVETPPVIKRDDPPIDDPPIVAPVIKHDDPPDPPDPPPVIKHDDPPPQPKVVTVDVDRSPLAERTAFETRDRSISYRLTNRGLNWRDLVAAAPEATQAWGLWRIGADQPTVNDLDAKTDVLETAIAHLVVDRSLLEAKLERVRKIFTDLPDSKKDARYTSLLGRWNALRSRAARAVGDDVKIRLASEVTLLETDAQLHATSGEAREDLAPIEAPEVLPPLISGEELDDGTVSSTSVAPF